MRFPAMILVGTLIFSVDASARDKHHFYVNETVFLKPGATARLEQNPVDVNTIPFPATVKKVEGDSLWLETAWVLKKDVMSARAAVEFYTEETQKRPNEAVLWRNLGVAWGYARVQGEDAFAQKSFAEAIRLDPNDPVTYKARASSYSGHQKYDDAIKDLTEAIRLDPNDAEAFDDRGTAYCWKWSYVEGIEDFSEAIRLKPEMGDYYRHRAQQLLHVGDLDGYLRDYETVIRLKEEDTPYERNYSGACTAVATIRATWPEAKYRNAEQALKLANDAHETSQRFRQRGVDDDENLLEVLSYALAESGDYDQALKLAKQSLKMWEKDRGFPKNSSWYKKNVNEMNARIDLFKKHEPYRDSQACRRVAWAKATCRADKYRDGKRALELAKIACELTSWKEFHCLEALAAAHAECGDFSKAIEWQQKAIESVTEDQADDIRFDKQQAEERLKNFQAKQPIRE